MTKLSVNINKIALIRNSRGSDLPNLEKIAIDCEQFGADGITVHPRPDERHIKYNDLPILKSCVKTEFNIEGYPSARFMDHVLNVKPDQCTLVPDPPGVLTSDRGWQIKEEGEFLKDVIARLKENRIRVSLFVNADEQEVENAKEVGADRVELYTGDYARMYDKDKNKAVLHHINASRVANECKLGLNAGHDLNLNNLSFYASSVYNLKEVSIGHAIVCDSIYYGLKNVIQMYKRCLD